MFEIWGAKINVELGRSALACLLRKQERNHTKFSRAAGLVEILFLMYWRRSEGLLKGRYRHCKFASCCARAQPQVGCRRVAEERGTLKSRTSC